MKKLSPEVQELYDKYNTLPVSYLALSPQEKFLHYFCGQYNLQGDIHSSGNKFYFVIKHPTFRFESQITKSDYAEVVNDCIGYCDLMIAALVKNKEEKEING